jgi:hypothetical protein
MRVQLKKVLLSLKSILQIAKKFNVRAFSSCFQLEN